MTAPDRSPPTSNSVPPASNSVPPASAVRTWVQRVLIASLVVLTLGTILAVVARSGAAEVELATAAEAPERIIVVTTPRLRWADVTDDTPNLAAFAGDGVIASMSVRTLGPVTDPPEGYLTLGAGNRAGAPPSSFVQLDRPGLVYGPDEMVEGQTAAEVFEERTGVDPTGVALAVNIGAIIEYNEALKYGSQVGSLADALTRDDRQMAAIGNADLADPERRSRAAALMAITPDGQVAAGSVTPSLLMSDDESAGGVRLDPGAVAKATSEALDSSDVVVVELSDLERAAQVINDKLSPAEAERLQRRALQQSDEVLGEVLDLVDPSRDLTLMLTPDVPFGPAQLGIFAAQGPGLDPGWARSASTRRTGYVTLTDIAPSILAAFDIKLPTSMPDTRLIRSADRAGGQLPIAELTEANDTSVCIMATHDPAATVFVVLIVLLVLLTLGLWYFRPTLVRHLAVPALTLMAVPPVAFMMGLSGRLACVPPPLYVALMVGGSAVLAFAVMALTRRCLVAAPVVIAALSFVVLVVDLWTGATLQIDTVFGYSPQVAGRFAGLGNLAFALLAVSALILASVGQALVWPSRQDGDEPGSTRASPVVLVAIGLLAITTVIVDGHPALGSDVGGVLALVPAFSIIVLLLAGRRVGWKTMGLIGIGTVAVLGVFGAIDLARPPDQRTHLGRFLESVANGEAGTILSRKIDANLSILTSSVWSLVLPVAAVFVVFLATRSNTPLTEVLRRVPGMRLLVDAAMLCALLGAALNDSGVAIIGLFLAVLVPMTLFLLTRLDEIQADYPVIAGHRRPKDA